MYKIKRTLPSNTHNIVQSYLKDCKFRIKYNEYVSIDYDSMPGIPHESVVGPTLYLIFTADLPISDKVLISTFSDDTAILSSHNNPVIGSVELNNNLKRMELWFSNCK